MPDVQPTDGNDDSLADLREAARLAPRNVALRQTLGHALLDAGLPAEAETAFRDALHLAPSRLLLQLGLTRAFLAQNKHSHALALVESITQSSSAPPSALLLHARILEATGDAAAALEPYRRALELDPALADPELAERLGFDPDDPDDLDPDPDPFHVPAPSDPHPQPIDDPFLSPPVERPPIRFSDVGGMDTIKEEIRLKIIHPLAHADLYRAYGKTIGGGILLYGPPGCGKTHLARATAGEIEASFINVGINDVLDMWLGKSERNLHELFENARRHRPCVLFFDEVDALGNSRSDLRLHAARQLVNQFLAEFDGVRASNEGVLVLAATNAPWHLDTAFRRPGRFDRILFVPPPDLPARSAILRLQLAGKPIADLDLDLDAVARRTEHFSGADLKAVVDLAVEAKLREALQAGVPRPIATRDLLAAVSGLKPTTREWFASARNYALYANQGGFYDDVAAYLKMT